MKRKKKKSGPLLGEQTDLTKKDIGKRAKEMGTSCPLGGKKDIQKKSEMEERRSLQCSSEKKGGRKKGELDLEREGVMCGDSRPWFGEVNRKSHQSP